MRSVLAFIVFITLWIVIGVFGDSVLEIEHFSYIMLYGYITGCVLNPLDAYIRRGYTPKPLSQIDQNQISIERGVQRRSD